MPLSARPAGDGLAEPDLNPLVDIAFLLLLFFILATTFLKTAGSRLDIPAGKASTEPAKSLTINLSATEINWGEKSDAVQIDELRRRLVAERLGERKEASERIVVVDSRKDVPFQRFFEVVMAIEQAGGVLALVDGGDEERPAKGGAPEPAGEAAP